MAVIGQTRGRQLTLPRIEPADVLALRTRSAPRARLRVPRFEAELEVDPGGEKPPGPALSRLDLLWGDHPLRLWCPRGVVAEVLDLLSPGIQPDSLPPDLAALMLEAALLPAVRAAEEATGRDIRFVGWTAEADSQLEGDALRAVVERQGRRWSVAVDSPDCGGAPVAALLSLWPVSPRAMDGLPFPAVVRLGSTPLTMGQLRSLKPGDAVLVATGGRSAMLVVAETWLAEATRDGPAWRLAAPPRPARSRDEKEWTMTDDDDADGREQTVGDPDELPVRVSFDVGRLALSLGELRRLGTGSVLDLGRSVDDLVRITVGGQLVGQGQLVDLHGTVGVRISRIFDLG